MEKMKHIEQDLICRVYQELQANEATNFKSICTKQLGEVIDMIKDIEQAIYYKVVTDAMNTK